MDKDEFASVDENVIVIDNINKMIAYPFSCTTKFFHSLSMKESFELVTNLLLLATQFTTSNSPIK
jgi:hypothetical protein